jgi:hypothetical protein
MSVINLPNSGLGWDFRQCPNAPIPGAIGGHEYGGAQYLFLYQGSEFGAGDLKIHALKSTDLGVTWTDTGNINIPPVVAGPPNAVPTYTTCMDGSTVYLMAVDIDGTGFTPADQTTGPVLLWKYNLAADTFDSGGTLSGAPTVWKGWNGATYPLRSGIWLHLLRRGSGDMLLLYTGVETIGANKFSRIFVATFNGSSCGGGTMLAGQAGASFPYIERCAGIDASGNLHVIFANPGIDHLFHVGMNPAGSFGTIQTVETDFYSFTDTSNLLDFPAPADTIAFLAVRNASSSGDNGDLAIYSAAGGSLNPTWTFHNLPSTANVVQDPVIAPDWIGALGFLDGTLHAFWTQTGIPHTWLIGGKMGEIRSSIAAATNLTAWTAETSVMGPFDSGGKHWGAGQVGVWSGSSIGLGVLGNFEGVDDGGTGLPIETSKLLVFPPSGGGGTAPTVSCGSPPGGNVGVPYSHTMPNTHTGAFTVAVAAGALPDGLTMSTSGLITGTPTVAGTFTYTATITDTVGTGEVACSITIAESSSLGLGCASPPAGVVGVEYLHRFPVSGGIPPYTFAIISGSLPPGLTLDSLRGEVSGTPTLAGDFEFTVQVSDDFGSTAGTCDIVITVTDEPASGIGCGSTPGGEIGVPYSHTFPVTDIPSGATVVYSITGGALPPGLTLNTSTGQVTGTPTTSGNYHFTVTATITS